ncbi:hypothetical protein LOC68_05490 [Blastopirellula sp. JC732]|uniref:Uncharacterized protein n=1 Tax=Blastopirellula sediminis TaxID=2894196 RepID=A0A9X1MJS8_9BACT|nr:hypothetical protein [Blastopirellula sediminis]MCC9609382.1 hypothetical protein [Blastopirellula sediminis]MCC9627841.1 hypothetical protein [Blastopirellula sediminis]
MTANALESKLRDALRKLDPHQAQEIREAYYKSVEGLQSLAETLEYADIELGETNEHILIDEHLVACEAIEAMNKSLLGKIL